MKEIIEEILGGILFVALMFTILILGVALI